MTDWKKERKKVDSHSSAFSLPHCILYRMVKNPDPITLKKHTEKIHVQRGDTLTDFSFYYSIGENIKIWYASKTKKKGKR